LDKLMVDFRNQKTEVSNSDTDSEEA